MVKNLIKAKTKNKKTYYYLSTKRKYSFEELKVQHGLETPAVSDEENINNKLLPKLGS